MTRRRHARDRHREHDWPALADDDRAWGRELGFQQIGIADTELSAEPKRTCALARAGRHGDDGLHGAPWHARARVPRSSCPARCA